MPRSMTGYGASHAAGARVRAEVEIRAVNGRALKISVRAPALLAPRESELEALVRKVARRGSLVVYVRLQFVRSEDLVRIRSEVVEGFAKAVQRLRKQGLVEGPLTVEALTAVPGALEGGAEDPLRPADWRVIKQALVGALEALDTMRQREAQHLVRSLRMIVGRMRKTLGHIRRRQPRVVREYQAKLKERLDALLEESGAALDDATLAREVALFADRCDITEEITRLAAHLDECDGYLGRDGEVGRTLEFLGQELLREANTIGSKSADVDLAKDVIALKGDIDRLKEQVANLE
ncbi:MAG: YicC/YloC family endoribonuclease [Planctomycetota bacterium]